MWGVVAEKRRIPADHALLPVEYVDTDRVCVPSSVFFFCFFFFFPFSKGENRASPPTVWGLLLHASRLVGGGGGDTHPSPALLLIDCPRRRSPVLVGGVPTCPLGGPRREEARETLIPQSWDWD